MQEWEKDGDIVMKQWQSVHDSRVRPTHKQNEADGWIDFNARFS